jgi:hypothetical protein
VRFCAAGQLRRQSARGTRDDMKPCKNDVQCAFFHARFHVLALIPRYRPLRFT